MSDTTNQVTTAEQLAALPDDGNRYELVEGVLRMMPPPGFRHGRIVSRLLRRIGSHVEEHHLGETSAENGFLIQRDPDTVRAPNVSFVAMDRLNALDDDSGYPPLAPDLAIEVTSPHDRPCSLEDKAQAWLDAGARTVLVVDPASSVVRQYRAGREVRVHADGLVDLDDVLPGFQLDVAELFA